MYSAKDGDILDNKRKLIHRATISYYAMNDLIMSDK